MSFITRQCFTCPRKFDIDTRKGNPVQAMCPACKNRINGQLKAREDKQNEQVSKHQ